MTTVPERFPSVDSPFYRSRADKSAPYTIDPWSVKPEFEWVFDRAHEVEAVEKLDGTNCAVVMDGGQPTEVWTRMGDKRMQKAEPFGETMYHYIVRGVQNSQRRGYLDELDSGTHFGELVGPKIQRNPHRLDEHLFIPFQRARRKYTYKTYGQYDTDYDSLREWFRGGRENGIFSLFGCDIHGQEPSESTPMNGMFVEGVVFVHPDFNGRIHPDDLTRMEDNHGKVKELAKIRRDMFHDYHNVDDRTRICELCDGKGENQTAIDLLECPPCDGTGEVPDEWPMNERRH